MPKDKPDLVYGTLDMLILKALQHEVTPLMLLAAGAVPGGH